MKLRNPDGSPSSIVAYWVHDGDNYALVNDQRGILLIGTLEQVSQALMHGDPLGSTTFGKHDGYSEFNRGGLVATLVFSRCDALIELENLRRELVAA